LQVIWNRLLGPRAASILPWIWPGQCPNILLKVSDLRVEDFKHSWVLTSSYGWFFFPAVSTIESDIKTTVRKTDGISVIGAGSVVAGFCCCFLD
jgi:hypothetical protein